MSHRSLIAGVLFLCLVTGCSRKTTDDAMEGTAVVAITGDADSFNPVVANSSTAGDVTSVLYPMMFDISFDLKDGKLVYAPGFVRSWEWSPDGRDITLHLRSDVKWEDGIPVTAQDVKFSYSLYGNEDVASPRSNYVAQMVFTNGRFDPDKSMTVVNDSTIIFHFTARYPQQLFHLTLSPVPQHIYGSMEPRSLRALSANQKPVGAGPFRLERWDRQQQVVLTRNPKCSLPYPSKLDRVIFRVITEPTTRLTELKKGTVDVMQPVYMENVRDLQEKTDIRLQTLPPRVYEYIGWSNIDIEQYAASGGTKVLPHPLFGDRRVRQALTYAIDRPSILRSQLGPYGDLAVTDFSPIFRWAAATEIVPYPFDPEKARALLREAGWADTDGDAILDKKGRKFEFSLYYNVGNKRREYVATVVQENLKQLGIRVNIQAVEATVMYQNVEEKKYDAFIAGFRVPLAIDPSDRWGDIHNPFNTVAFSNARVTELLKLGLSTANERDAGPFWKEMQLILHQEQPCTFLYWIKDIVGVNPRLRNTSINVLGVTDRMWDWTTGDPGGSFTN